MFRNIPDLQSFDILFFNFLMFFQSLKLLLILFLLPFLFKFNE